MLRNRMRDITGWRRLTIEPLENRRMLTVEVNLTTVADLPPGPLEAMAESAQPIAEGESNAEGEDANDLVDFASKLASSGARLFCAAWLEECTQQKELFEDGGRLLSFIEVTNPNRTANQTAFDEGITVIPTWEFGDGSRQVGILSLQELSQASGVSIPQSSLPRIANLPDVSVGIGSPLHLALDAYDPNGGRLSITATSSNPSLLEAQVLSGNRSLLLSVQGFGDMVFELFEDRAPAPTGRVIQLAESGFYNNTIFHRVIEDFVVQGGDPTGTGRGGSTLGDFDDQYHLQLQHNAPGILSFAKSAVDDTNDSQFFITDAALRFLDFNHSVFGMLVEGEANRKAVNAVLTNFLDRPVYDVILESAAVFEDSENAVVLLNPTGVGTGSVSVEISVTDPEGNVAQQTIQVEIVQDTANGAPFLNPIPLLETCANQDLLVQLTAQDKEGDVLRFNVEPVGEVEFEMSVNPDTGWVSITPPPDFHGALQFIASVQQTTPTTTASPTDTQLVQVRVGSTHHNAVVPGDVNNDKTISPIDALLVIIYLNTGKTTHVDSLPADAPFVDVNGDCFLSPIDALMVINELNADGEGEAEALDAVRLQWLGELVQNPRVARCVANRDTLRDAEVWEARTPLQVATAEENEAACLAESLAAIYHVRDERLAIAADMDAVLDCLVDDRTLYRKWREDGTLR